MITNTNIGYNGRFGNQLFQFAATIGIGNKLGYDVVFPKKNITTGFHQKTADGKHFLAKLDILDCFDVDDKYFSDNIEYSEIKNENHFHFDETMFHISDNTNLNGYFQSEKYFEHCSDLILKALPIKQDLIETAKALLPDTKKELVLVHIRRSDYLVLSDYHSVNGVEYINSAIDCLKDGVDYHFIVVSDDPIWCKSIWGNKDNFTIIDTKNPMVDFTIITLCKHHIISNSSFGWWGSYLSKSTDKMIIAPKNWFGPKCNNITTDIYAKNMIII